MLLKTINEAGNIVLEDYTDNECNDILIQRNSYVLKCVDVTGEDEGRSEDNEKIVERYEEIIPERILVKNNKFYGVLIQTEYHYYNGGSMISRKFDDVILTPNHRHYARDGYNYSFEDHSRWSYTDFYLVEREEQE